MPEATTLFSLPAALLSAGVFALIVQRSVLGKTIAIQLVLGAVAVFAALLGRLAGNEVPGEVLALVVVVFAATHLSLMGAILCDEKGGGR